jgi:phage tail sheath protein FI
MTPGVYVEEVPGGPRPIQAVGTSTAGFVGIAPRADHRVNEAVAINNWSQFVREFVPENDPRSTPLSNAVYGFLENGGTRCFVVNVGADGSVTGAGRDRVGLEVLEAIDEVAIVLCPGLTATEVQNATLSHCENAKDRVAILDAPEEVRDIGKLTQLQTAEAPTRRRTRGAAAPAEGAEPPASDGGETNGGGFKPRPSEYGTFYFPWLTILDPIENTLVDVPPSGHVAGIWARSDAMRGVHKAPANEVVRGALNVTYRLTREEQGVLNQEGVNCIRLFGREGIRVWGARTLADQSGEWRYLNVRRLFNMVEESIAQSTNWIVFEPNDRTLWKNIRRDVGAFLTLLWRDGALMGSSPEEAFFVKCDEETNPKELIDAGQVVTVIGMAPVKPAEFIVFRLSQSAEGAEVLAEGR